MLSRPQSYRKFVGIDYCKSLWRSWQYSAISKLKNIILDAWGKIPFVQFQKLVDSMPTQIFEVIQTNDRSTKFAFMFYSAAH